MKAAQTEPLQANHHFTPDAIGFIITFLIDQLAKSDQLDVLEVGSGTEISLRLLSTIAVSRLIT